MIGNKKIENIFKIEGKKEGREGREEGREGGGEGGRKLHGRNAA